MTDIPLRPRPASRPRFGQGRTYHDADYERWLDAAAWHMTRLPKHSGPVEVSIVVHADRFSFEVTPCERSRPTGVRGDIDNFAKAVLDAAERAGVFGNDRQVQALTIRFG